MNTMTMVSLLKVGRVTSGHVSDGRVDGRNTSGRAAGGQVAGGGGYIRDGHLGGGQFVSLDGTLDEVAVFGIEEAAKIEKLVLRVTGGKITVRARSRIPVIENERRW